MKKLLSKFLSRKFLAKLVGVGFAGLAAKYPDWQPVLPYAEGVIMTYILGESLVDAHAAKAASPANLLGYSVERADAR
jgi:hypothetical protein